MVFVEQPLSLPLRLHYDLGLRVHYALGHALDPVLELDFAPLFVADGVELGSTANGPDAVATSLQDRLSAVRWEPCCWLAIGRGMCFSAFNSLRVEPQLFSLRVVPHIQ